MDEISEKEILAIKALRYLAVRNTRHHFFGDTYVEDMRHFETSRRISFVEAVKVVDAMLCRIEEAQNE
jgi:hypothetical protein